MAKKKKFIKPKLIKCEKPLDKVTLNFAIPYGNPESSGKKGKCPLFS